MVMKKKRILKFSKDNCLACDQLATWLDKKGIDYETYNPFDHPELAGQYKIKSVPTLIVLNDKEVVSRLIGFKPEELNTLFDQPL